ncbi:phospholipase D-like domain-containing protein [Paracoccus salsus]|uniref:phospholipase D-like domain-containing protein n=1 Tax=Paracoccus salsus TaxID=2911061 RepID=UPI001F169834|nr:phospholipase D-like domain-containing protein [Paracoccus salsus]MCF3974988.1 phospholipase D-like domain-containing protein [Paracoccus salsus]
MDATRPVLRPGETCWRIETADRLAVIVDAADYFSALHEVMQKAQHSVIMVGWEFDTRIDLDPRKEPDDAPHKLGRFLSWLVRRRPDLRIHLLQWDVGLLGTLGRGSTPLRLADWLIGRRIRLKLDHAHASGAAHHQKIIVIDDALAFCGGIDATAERWDTSEHADDSPCRVRPTTKRSYGPWHEASIAVDGAAARALGDLVRKRWEYATGEKIPPPPAVKPLWPETLEPLLKDFPVAISRTSAGHAGREAVHEIEALYLAIIAATRRTLYIESQYFASRTLAEAIAARLADPDGPEFVVVNPESAQGWLEEKAMGSARARLLALVRKADAHKRFRLYTPVTQGGTPIYVHAKIVIMDDTLMRVGSSNLNNRSMGFDTECDLSVEVTEGLSDEDSLRAKIAGLRTALVAEHLGVAPRQFERAVDTANGSLIGAIEATRGDGRSLVPFEPPDFGVIADAVLRENDLLDPERPARRWPWS